MSFDVGDVATLDYSLTVGGVLTDATVVLTVTAPDGTVSAPAPTHSSTGVYTADVLVTQIGTWRYRWAASGTATDVTNGSFEGAANYFTLEDLRGLPDLANATRYPDAALTRARAWITAVIERQCRTSFVLREFTDTLNGSDAGMDGTLMLSRQWVRSLTTVTIDGTALDSGDLTACYVSLAGAVARNRYSFDGYGGGATDAQRFSAWPRGSQNVVVVYTAGFSDAPPDDLKEVAMQAARWRVVNVDGKTGVGSRVLSETNDFGTVRMSVASTNYPTGIPDVDSVINGWAELTRIPATG